MTSSATGCSAGAAAGLTSSVNGTKISTLACLRKFSTMVCTFLRCKKGISCSLTASKGGGVCALESSLKMMCQPNWVLTGALVY